VAPVFARNLIEDRIGLTVALLDHVAVGIDNRVVDREDIERLGIRLQKASLAGLPVVGIIMRIAQPDRMVRGDLVRDVADDAIPARAGLARSEHADRIEPVTVAVEIDPHVGAAAEEAELAVRGGRGRRIGDAVGAPPGTDHVVSVFPRNRGAAAVGFHELIAGVERQGQRFGRRELTGEADVARIGRVIAAVELAAAAVRRVSYAGDGGRCRAIVVDVVEAVFAGRRKRRKAERAEEVVPVLVVVPRQRDEVAVRADVLPDARVVLLLVNDAVVIERVVITSVARGRERLGAEAGEVARVDHRKTAHVEMAGILALAEHVARGDRSGHLGRVAGLAGADVDRAANCRGSGAVDVGRAQVDVDRCQRLRVLLLVGVQRVVAGIVQWDTVDRLRDAVGREAADRERAARRAPRVVVLEAHTRDEVDDVVDRLPGTLATDDFLAENLLGLGRVRDFDAGNIGVAGAGNDDHVILEVDRAR